MKQVPSLYIVEILEPHGLSPYRIIEKVQTTDGPRDRITSHTFATRDMAELYVKRRTERIAKIRSK